MSYNGSNHFFNNGHGNGGLNFSRGGCNGGRCYGNGDGHGGIEVVILTLNARFSISMVVKFLVATIDMMITMSLHNL